VNEVREAFSSGDISLTPDDTNTDTEDDDDNAEGEQEEEEEEEPDDVVGAGVGARAGSGDGVSSERQAGAGDRPPRLGPGPGRRPLQPASRHLRGPGPGPGAGPGLGAAAAATSAATSAASEATANALDTSPLNMSTSPHERWLGAHRLHHGLEEFFQTCHREGHSVLVLGRDPHTCTCDRLIIHHIITFVR